MIHLGFLRNPIIDILHTSSGFVIGFAFVFSHASMFIRSAALIEMNEKKTYFGTVILIFAHSNWGHF